MKKILVVVDMQNDFISGALGSRQAREITQRVARKIRTYNGEVCYTMDTHTDDYLSTREGRYLPVAHCIEGTDGWQLCEEVRDALAEKDAACFIKHTFASDALAEYMKSEQPDEVELIGVCTDICVVSNALMLRAVLENAKIIVDSACCAGVTEEKHRAALAVMESCQIEIK